MAYRRLLCILEKRRNCLILSALHTLNFHSSFFVSFVIMYQQGNFVNKKQTARRWGMTEGKLKRNRRRENGLSQQTPSRLQSLSYSNSNIVKVKKGGMRAYVFKRCFPAFLFTESLIGVTIKKTLMLIICIFSGSCQGNSLWIITFSQLSTTTTGSSKWHEAL